ncbi:MAG: response regulator [Desulfobacteraceae bacterium]|jgi:DNA-binding NtrC family response regulator|nr:response regulator [Desulfobacteraceae bacterium]
MKPVNILVIDDESVICNACHLILSEKGYMVERQLTGKSGLDALKSGQYHIVMLDMMLPDMDGMDILKMIKKEKPETCIIIMTGYSTVSNAVKAMKFGAYDYLAKPFTDDELVSAVEKACLTVV